MNSLFATIHSLFGRHLYDIARLRAERRGGEGREGKEGPGLGGACTKKKTTKGMDKLECKNLPSNERLSYYTNNS